MAFTQDVDPDAGVLHVRILGVLTGPDVRALRAALPESLDFKGILLDYSGCEGIQLHANELQTLAQESVTWRGSRRFGPIVMLAPQPVQFGIARMYQALAELVDPERGITVVRDLDAARSSLGLPPDWRPPGA